MSNSSFSFLASESGQPLNTPKKEPWIILLVDDEPEIHQVTTMALSRFTYEGRSLEFLHAYSKAQAIEMMQSETRVSVILLDVIMETDTAGLDCVREIRHVLKNKTVRIILRTGQPSTIPEHEVMLKYDINDYKNKVDLTKSRLYIAMTSALRAYQDIERQAELINALKDLNDNLEERVVERTSELQLANLELIQAKQQIIAQQQSLLQSEKMASIGQLAAGVAHEINNPLGAMKCNFDVLADYIEKFSKCMKERNIDELTPDLADIKEILEDTDIDMNRIAKIVNALSIFNGISGEESISLNIKEVVEQFVASLQQPLQVSYSIVEGADWNLRCCRGQLLQVLEILYVNSVESGTKTGDIELTIASSQNAMQITVKDRGDGIEASKLTRIFDPFYTTKPIGQNLGLGLTIALVLAKHNSGNISVESELGVGSCFDVRFSKVK
ncbi:ATP-binding protein [Pseudoalteromonas luteoviolacea]|uniref:ATP-binding protein n=1 Tax=Pseudoalteromonas luteoviolacea TaxID=43657 RepID=UPI00114E13B6|nr:ATP-binding protein [Pseudoalteromonas luteoviolacea]TQF67522.1 response regulator [Pseudoalteromonas luteoviolacea]